GTRARRGPDAVGTSATPRLPRWWRISSQVCPPSGVVGDTSPAAVTIGRVTMPIRNRGPGGGRGIVTGRSVDAAGVGGIAGASLETNADPPPPPPAGVAASTTRPQQANASTN